jgi:hypothetical protein
VRVHQALTELVRGERAEGRPDPTARLVGVREQEQRAPHDALEERCERPVSEREPELAHALVTGLRLQLAAAETTRTWEAAAGMLREHVARSVVVNQFAEGRLGAEVRGADGGHGLVRPLEVQAAGGLAPEEEEDQLDHVTGDRDRALPLLGTLLRDRGPTAVSAS